MGALVDVLHGRNGERHQDEDDRHHNEQFDEGETGLGFRGVMVCSLHEVGILDGAGSLRSAPNDRFSV